jgi:hypothetical protein
MRCTALVLGFSCALVAHADNTAQTLPFNQNWSNTGLITANDNWSGVPGIEGYLGQDITTTTGTDPQTLTGTSAIANDLSVLANQTSTSISNGDVIEFHVTDPVVGLQGSGTADAPYLLINLDTTGQTGINVAYNVRDLDGTTDNAVQPVALQYRVGNSGAFVNVPAGYVADATSGPSLATLVTPVSASLPAAADNQPLVQVRIITANAVGNDESVGIDDISITSGVSGPVTPVLTISDAAITEGDGGTQTLLFTASLSAPAGAGGASFDYLTHDLTATAGSDYVATTGTAQIPEGQTSVTIGVVVNGDTDNEGNETFVFDTTNVVGMTGIGGKGSGTGTIYNDDMAKTAIHAVQGNSQLSPLVGNTVTVRGIVTGRKSNGFFVQAPNAESDTDPATSEGVYVFTNVAPPSTAAVGNLVLVTGAVSEYVPSADPGQLPLTEMTSPSVVFLAAGQPLPAAMSLTPTLPAPDGGLEQLERYEGMRVTADSFTVVAPTKGSTNEPNATGTSNGIFSVVVTGVARPLREPGIQTPDPDPAGTTATSIPRWDFNPELLTVDSDGAGGAQLNVPAGTVLSNLVGPLDYGFRRYTILAEAGTTVDVGPMPVPTAARMPTPDEFTVAGYNMERFFDTTNDPAISEPVLTAAAFDKRLAKASIAIRDYLHSPDIVAVVEVENFSTLKTLADRINADAAAAPQPSFPGYVPYLVEGNDVGGIDVGFLVKTLQAGGVERVHVANVMQYGKSEAWLDPSDNAQHLLNDRPPLLLYADVHFTDGRVFPVNVLVVHQRSLNGVDSELADGATTEGDRVRRKRQAQAEYLANLVQTLGSGSDHLVVLGDFNAFEFNDGYADAMGTVMGTPSADNQTAVNGDGADLVTPDLINLVAFEDADQHYSFVFDGNAQSLDHVLVNERLAVDAGAIDMDHARINADFPETARNDATSPARLSDHDPAIAYVTVASADLSIELTAPASATVGQGLSFQATLTNHGGYDARYPGVGFSLNAEIDGVVVTPAAGWACDAPQIGSGATTVACSATSLADAATASFTVSAVAPALSGYGTLTLVAAANSQTQDLLADNNSASASVQVGAVSDLAVAVQVASSTATDVTYRVQVSNTGPNEARAAELLIDTNLPLGYEAFRGAAGWSCSFFGAGGTAFSCTLEEDAVASGAHADFEITIPRKLMKPSYYIHGVVDCVTDPSGGNNEARRRLGMPSF